MRSSKRAPIHTITSQSCMAMLALKVPCMPSMPSQFLPGRRSRRRAPISVEVDRKPRQFHQLAQQVAGFATGIDHPAAGIDDPACAPWTSVRTRGLDLLQIAMRLRMIAGPWRRLRRHVHARRELDVLRVCRRPTGPGRPVVATWKASCMTAARSLTSFTSQLCLVQGPL